MADRYVAVTRGFAYPVGADLAAVRKAGGFPKMSPAEQQRIRFKRVEIGEDCSDMPAEGLARYLERGDVAKVETTTKGKA